MDPKYPWTHIVLAGAGMNGLAYLGALEALEECISFQQLTHWCGVSSGAIIATLIVAGLTCRELETFFLELSFPSLINTRWTHQMWMLLTRWGILSPETILASIAKLLERCVPSKITLHELYVKTGKHLWIGVYDVVRGCTVFLSHATHPDTLVMDAIHATMAVPIIFPPARVSFGADSSKLFIDGGVETPFPTTVFPDGSNVLGIQVVNTYGLPMDVPRSLISYLALLARRALQFTANETHSKDLASISIEIAQSSVISLDFELNAAQIQKLFDYGRDATRAFLESFLSEGLT